VLHGTASSGTGATVARVSVYETLNHISAYEILAALGAFFELVGFVWVIAGVSYALSEEYDKPGIFAASVEGLACGSDIGSRNSRSHM
jgi:hypothetical protein